MKFGPRIVKLLNKKLVFQTLRAIIMDITFPEASIERSIHCKQKAFVLLAGILKIPKVEWTHLEVMLKEKQSVRKIREMLKK